MSSRAQVALRLSSLGDLVLCSAFARALRARFPDDRLYFWVDETFVDLVRSFGARIEALPFPRGPWSLPRAFLAGWRFARRMARENCEVAAIFDLHGVGKSLAFRAGFFCARPSAPVRVRATPKAGLRRRLSVLFHRDLLGSRFVYREHLRLLGDEDTVRPHLDADGATRASGSILIAPDASKWKKKWPADYWLQFLRRLLRDERGYRITLVGPLQSLPIDVTDELESLGGERFRNLLGRTSLKDLPGLAAAHELTICGNSAWLHISEAVGTPVVALAGPIVPGFGFSPWRPESRELAVPLVCRPCTLHGGGPCVNPKHHACMKLLTPDRLWQVFANRSAP